MIGHERPGEAVGVGRHQQLSQPLGKQGLVILSAKDISAVNAAYYHMMEKTGNVDPSRSWHKGILVEVIKQVNRITYVP